MCTPDNIPPFCHCPHLLLRNLRDTAPVFAGLALVAGVWLVFTAGYGWALGVAAWCALGLCVMAWRWQRLAVHPQHEHGDLDGGERERGEPHVGEDGAHVHERPQDRPLPPRAWPGRGEDTGDGGDGGGVAGVTLAHGRAYPA